jgi:hypothetical protein
MMTSTNPNSGPDGRKQNSRKRPDESEDDGDDIEEVHRITEEDRRCKSNGDKNPNRPSEPKEEERPKTPAYVAPIPKIGSIGKIPPVSPGAGISPTERPYLPPVVGSFLIGKLVDEYGDIVDETGEQVFAHAGGDLPSIVGRRVSNQKGDILGDDGELLGWVESLELGQKDGGDGNGQESSPSSPNMPKARNLADLLGRGSASLMVDHTGNIMDASGNVVGRFHDNNNPLHRKEKEEREAREREMREKEEQNRGRGPAESGTQEKETAPDPPRQEEPKADQDQPRPRRTESERRRNAESWRKENPGESPSDIFLDVKSTTEGIQLTIRIPTVFGNGQQVRPNISFSS